ncbi:hypothetical protein [Mycobacterium sp. URHB0021]
MTPGQRRAELERLLQTPSASWSLREQHHDADPETGAKQSNWADRWTSGAADAAHDLDVLVRAIRPASALSSDELDVVVEQVRQQVGLAWVTAEQVRHAEQSLQSQLRWMDLSTRAGLAGIRLGQHLDLLVAGVRQHPQFRYVAFEDVAAEWGELWKTGATSADLRSGVDEQAAQIVAAMGARTTPLIERHWRHDGPATTEPIQSDRPPNELDSSTPAGRSEVIGGRDRSPTPEQMSLGELAEKWADRWSSGVPSAARELDVLIRAGRPLAGTPAALQLIGPEPDEHHDEPSSVEESSVGRVEAAVESLGPWEGDLADCVVRVDRAIANLLGGDVTAMSSPPRHDVGAARSIDGDMRPVDRLAARLGGRFERVDGVGGLASLRRGAVTPVWVDRPGQPMHMVLVSRREHDDGLVMVETQYRGSAVPIVDFVERTTAASLRAGDGGLPTQLEGSLRVLVDDRGRLLQVDLGDPARVVVTAGDVSVHPGSGVAGLLDPPTTTTPGMAQPRRQDRARGGVHGAGSDEAPLDAAENPDDSWTPDNDRLGSGADAAQKRRRLEALARRLHRLGTTVLGDDELVTEGRGDFTGWTSYDARSAGTRDTSWFQVLADNARVQSWLESLTPADPQNVPPRNPVRLSQVLDAHHWWRLYVDSDDHAAAQHKNQDDPGSAYNHIPQGFIGARMEAAYRSVLDNLQALTQPIRWRGYLSMHRAATGHDGNISTGGRENPAALDTGTTALADDWANESVGDRFVVMPVASLRDVHRAEKHSLVVAVEFEGRLSLVPAYSSRELPKLVDEVFIRYHNDIRAATSEQARLRAIAQLVRTLHVMQVFPDSHPWINVHLLLQRLLLANGFRPVILPATSYMFSGGFSLEHIATALAWGQNHDLTTSLDDTFGLVPMRQSPGWLGQAVRAPAPSNWNTPRSFDLPEARETAKDILNRSRAVRSWLERLAAETEPEEGPDRWARWLPVGTTASSIWNRYWDPAPVPVPLSDVLPRGRWWRLYLTAVDHKAALENDRSNPGGLYDIDELAGYQADLESAYSSVLDNPNVLRRRLDWDEYSRMYARVTTHTSQSAGRSPFGVGGTSDPGQYFYHWVTLNELADDVREITLDGRPLVTLAEPHQKNDFIARDDLIAVAYPVEDGELQLALRFKPERLPAMVNEAFGRYYKELDLAYSEQARLRAIARVMLTLSVLHPFKDGNGRLHKHLLLQRLLLANGFRPVILPAAHYLFNGGFSLDQITAALRWGQSRNLETGLDDLRGSEPWFKSSSDVSRAPSPDAPGEAPADEPPRPAIPALDGSHAADTTTSQATGPDDIGSAGQHPRVAWRSGELVAMPEDGWDLLYSVVVGTPPEHWPAAWAPGSDARRAHAAIVAQARTGSLSADGPGRAALDLASQALHGQVLDFVFDRGRAGLPGDVAAVFRGHQPAGALQSWVASASRTDLVNRLDELGVNSNDSVQQPIWLGSDGLHARYIEERVSQLTQDGDESAQPPLPPMNRRDARRQARSEVGLGGHGQVDGDPPRGTLAQFVYLQNRHAVPMVSQLNEAELRAAVLSVSQHRFTWDEYTDLLLALGDWSNEQVGWRGPFGDTFALLVAHTLGVQVHQVGHALPHVGQEGGRSIRVFYRNGNHYDASFPALEGTATGQTRLSPDRGEGLPRAGLHGAPTTAATIANAAAVLDPPPSGDARRRLQAFTGNAAAVDGGSRTTGGPRVRTRGGAPPIRQSPQSEGANGAGLSRHSTAGDGVSGGTTPSRSPD